mmetsp:Transcript_23963/g.56929  ORF Transcript_23963/g.56929 Transcript_23963/m.56929 type:complete len:206 (-) Transcript_23963:9-626(-)
MQTLWRRQARRERRETRTETRTETRRKLCRGRTRQVLCGRTSSGRTSSRMRWLKQTQLNPLLRMLKRRVRNLCHLLRLRETLKEGKWLRRVRQLVRSIRDRHHLPLLPPPLPKQQTKQRRARARTRRKRRRRRRTKSRRAVIWSRQSCWLVSRGRSRRRTTRPRHRHHSRMSMGPSTSNLLHTLSSTGSRRYSLPCPTPSGASIL